MASRQLVKDKVERELSKSLLHLRYLTQTLKLAEQKIIDNDYYVAGEYLDIARHRLEVALIVMEQLEQYYELRG